MYEKVVDLYKKKHYEKQGKLGMLNNVMYMYNSLLQFH